MAVELISTGADGSLNFGDYNLETKSKLSDYEHFGDSYKIKTFREITKLECNDAFVYESVPGTAVTGFVAQEDKVSFSVEGYEDTQVALGLESGQEYQVYIDDVSTGSAKTNLGGKLIISVELGETPRKIEVIKA